MSKAHITLQRVRLDSQGYTQSGTYYGIGQPLYWADCWEKGLQLDTIFRAKNREDAKTHILHILRTQGFDHNDFRFTR